MTLPPLPPSRASRCSAVPIAGVGPAGPPAAACPAAACPAAACPAAAPPPPPPTAPPCDAVRAARGEGEGLGRVIRSCAHTTTASKFAEVWPTRYSHQASETVRPQAA